MALMALAASDEQRKLAATALFRLGECYRKLGRTNDAVVQYQRLIRDFTDQATLTTLSRQNLHGLGVSPAMTASGNEPRTSQSMTSEARARLRELLQSEIGIAERFAVEQRKKVEAGVLASGESAALTSRSASEKPLGSVTPLACAQASHRSTLWILLFTICVR